MEESKGNMSKIDLQIQELQRKKTLIEAYDLVSKKIKEVLKDQKYKDVLEEVEAEVSEFLLTKIDEVENGPKQEKKSVGEDINDDQVLQAMISQFKKRMSQQGPQESPYDDESSPKKTRTPKQKQYPDKISFALQNKHLENKKATAYVDGKEFDGVITGLDAPNVILKTPTGKFLEVPIDDINVKGE